MHCVHRRLPIVSMAREAYRRSEPPIGELGRKDSNLGMPGPKPGALPLGDAPLYRANVHSMKKIDSVSTKNGTL